MFKASNSGGLDEEKTMKNLKLRRLFVLAIAVSASFLLLSACSGTVGVDKPAPQPDKGSTPQAPTSPPPASPEVANPNEAAVQKLLGRWEGPEGTYLVVTEKKGPDGKQQLPRKFSIEIKDLDKAETFDGTANGKVIEFSRKGKTEAVRAANGTETGMKDFEKYDNCVVVTKGSEGFCRKPEEEKPVSTAPAKPSEEKK